MIAWEEAGAGTPAVLVHGITEDRRAWDRLVPLLEDGFRCVRLDLRGHGDSSDSEDYILAAMAEDVAVVAAEAGIDQPPVVIGHGLGALVATAYAGQAPVRAVVAIDQSMRLGEFALALQPHVAEMRGPEFPVVLAAVFRSLGMDKLRPEDEAYVTGKHAGARRDVVLGVWDQALEAPPDELNGMGESLLEAVTAPYLAIFGSDPGPRYAEWLQGRTPGATVEVWEGAGHYPHLVEPERVAARIRGFVRAAPAP